MSTSTIPSSALSPTSDPIAIGDGDGDGSGPWLDIPLLSARLLCRHWPALAFWFFAQRACYDLLMQLAVKFRERWVLPSFAALSVLIVTQLAGTILMFQSLRPSLPTLAGGATTPDKDAKVIFGRELRHTIEKISPKMAKPAPLESAG